MFPKCCLDIYSLCYRIILFLRDCKHTFSSPNNVNKPWRTFLVYKKLKNKQKNKTKPVPETVIQPIAGEYYKNRQKNKHIRK